MPTEGQYDAEYHCGIGKLLSTAYLCEFTMMEKGKVQKFHTFKDWYATLNDAQRATSL